MKVLLVEDNEDVGRIAAEYLLELGHETVTVTSGESALSKVRQSGFDAVITDLRLPGISGLELASTLAKECPELPVIISSGYEAHRVSALLQDLCKVKVLSKPYSLSDLEDVLSAAGIRKSGTQGQ